MTLNPYKTQLGRAIQHARSINADYYIEIFDLPILATPANRKYHNALRRLQQYCVILDRVSPLCTRFSLYITHNYFNFKYSITLGIVDLQDEIYRLSVFTLAIKRCLVALFSRFLEFIILLTDMLTLAFPFEDSVKFPQGPLEDREISIAKCDALLKDWYVRATAQFPPYEDKHKNQPGKNNEGTGSIVLHTNLMYIYYQ